MTQSNERIDQKLITQEKDNGKSRRLDIDELFSTIEKSMNKKLQETAGRKRITKPITNNTLSIPVKTTRKNNARARIGKTNTLHTKKTKIYKTDHEHKIISTGKKNSKNKRNDGKRGLLDTKEADQSNEEKVVKDKKEEIARRHTRTEQTLKRKIKIDAERREKLKSISSSARRKRLKERSTKKNKKKDRLRHWHMCIQIGSKLQLVIEKLVQFRAYQDHILLQDISARMITRQMRIYKFKCYRKRVRAALFILGSIFTIKVKLWKRSRRRIASDKLRAFLVALDKENRRTQGCLAKVIVKGKKWRAYRCKIVVLQRHWRDRIKISSAQVQLIDLQWRREQLRRTEEYVSSIHRASMQHTTMENDKIDCLNRTRRLVKLKPLPRRKHDTMNFTKNKVLKGEDLLNINHIVASEIRLGIIKDMLRHLRASYCARMDRYSNAVAEHEKDKVRIQNQRAILIGFSGSQIANTWVKAQHNERRLAESVTVKEPRKPRFRLILHDSTLAVLILTGENYAANIRKSWEPKSMVIPYHNFDGRYPAQVHLQYEGEDEFFSSG